MSASEAEGWAQQKRAAPLSAVPLLPPPQQTASNAHAVPLRVKHEAVRARGQAAEQDVAGVFEKVAVEVGAPVYCWRWMRGRRRRHKRSTRTPSAFLRRPRHRLPPPVASTHTKSKTKKRTCAAGWRRQTCRPTLASRRTSSKSPASRRSSRRRRKTSRTSAPRRTRRRGTCPAPAAPPPRPACS